MGRSGRVVRTVRVLARLPAGAFQKLVELSEAYAIMVRVAVEYGVRNEAYGYMSVYRALYREFRERYPWLPAPYAQEALRSAAQVLKSWRELRKLKIAEKPPKARSATVVVHPQCWRFSGFTAVEVAVRSDGKSCEWVRVEFGAHKQYLRYRNAEEWRPCRELRFKVDRKRRLLVLYLAFEGKAPEPYEPSGWVSVDVNEDSVAVLVDGRLYLFKTGFAQVTKFYYWKRRRLQSYCDKCYGRGSRVLKRALRRLRERSRKGDWRFKLARLVVREALRRKYGIAVEDLDLKAVWGMLRRVKSRMLRLRIAKACFLGVLSLVEEYAKMHGVPVKRVDPRNTSRLCPLHGCELEYDGRRLARCPVGGETWHREAAGCYNILARAGEKPPREPTRPIIVPREAWLRARDLEHALELAREMRKEPRALRRALHRYSRYIEALRGQQVGGRPKPGNEMSGA